MFFLGHSLAAVLAVAVAGWALAAVMAPRDAGWLHFGVALIVTVLLAFSVLTIRLRTYRELHAEHLAEVRAIRERYLGEREKVDSDVAGKASVLQARGEMDGLWIGISRPTGSISHRAGNRCWATRTETST